MRCFLRQNHPSECSDYFSLLDWISLLGSSINSVAKTAYMNTGVLIQSRESLFSKALFSNLKFIEIALAKSWSASRASRHPAFTGNCLAISHTS